jgi:hypothetical protein
MRYTTVLLSLIIFIGLTSCGHEHGSGTHTHGPTDNEKEHKHKTDGRGDAHDHYQNDKKHPPFSYLAMDGEFHLNPGDSISQNDPRNPGRIKLKTSQDAGTLTKMIFYDHDDINKKLAECGYEFIGSRPDPHYYPERSKTSIWDIFKKVKDISGNCENYEYVISRSPHGDPIHMHLRYGNDVNELLAMSNDEEDGNFNPWWATYCDIERNTSCD